MFTTIMDSILLFIITVLLFWDLYFLKKISKQASNKEELSDHAKYFELKFNINLIKAIAAILLFVIGYFGYSSFQEFTSNITQEFKTKTQKQQQELEVINNRLNQYQISIDSLELMRKQLNNTILSSEHELRRLNKKTQAIKNTLKYNPRIYVVKGLRFTKTSLIKNKPLIIYYDDLKTIHSEKLPNFNSAPLVNVQGHSIDIDIIKVTNELVKLGSYSSSIYPENKKEDFYIFDIWFASFE